MTPVKIALAAKDSGSTLCDFLHSQLSKVNWIDCKRMGLDNVDDTQDADIWVNVFEDLALNEILEQCAYLRTNKKKSISVSFWNKHLVIGPTHFPGKSAGADSALFILQQEHHGLAGKPGLKEKVAAITRPNDFQENTDLFYTAFSDIIKELKTIYDDKPDESLRFIDNVQLYKLNEKTQAVQSKRYIWPIFDSGNHTAFETSEDYKILVGKFNHSRSQIKKQFFVDRSGESQNEDEYQNVAIIGGGTAGYLTALLFKQEYPRMNVTLIESSKVPVIGVGEATTPEIRKFLFETLQFPALEFYEKVRPTWKLGIKFFWGLPGDYYFNYPFGWPDVRSAYQTDGNINTSSLTAALMDQDSSFVVETKGAQGQAQYSTLSDELFYALHLDNVRFISYLKSKAEERGIIYIDDLIVDAERKDDADELRAVIGENGTRYTHDFFVDCTGFRSLLLEKTLKSDFVPYNKSLFTDTAITGHIPDVKKIRPYTFAESMQHGWCWSIPMRGENHRGYVFSSSHCTTEDATREFLKKNPTAINTGIVKFRSGRHEKICIGNVFAIGNSFAFVEPLESTGIHMIIQETKVLVYNFRQLKKSPTLKNKINSEINDHWDYLRYFLSIHYKFNKKFDTPFWKDCRENTDISGIQGLVELYYETGLLSYANKNLLRTIERSIKDDIFGLVGFDVLMMGQGELPRNFNGTVRNKHIWEANVRAWKSIRSLTVPVEKDLDILNEHLESKW